MGYKLDLRNPHILPSFLADVLFIALLVGIFIGFGTVMEEQSTFFTQFQTPEQLEHAVTTGGEAVLEEVKSLVFAFTGGLVILILALLVGGALSRQYIWSRLVRRAPFWKWVGTLFLLGILGFVYIFPAGFVHGFLRSLLPFPVVSEILTIGLLLLFVVFEFSLFLAFVNSFQVWSSVGNAFSSFTQKRTWVMFLHAWIGGIAVLLILLLASLLFITIMPILTTILLLLYIAWFRVYFVSRFST